MYQQQFSIQPFETSYDKDGTSKEDYKFQQDLYALINNDDYPTWDTTRITAFQNFTKNLIERNFPVECVVSFQPMINKYTRGSAFLLTLRTKCKASFCVVLDNEWIKSPNCPRDLPDQLLKGFIAHLKDKSRQTINKDPRKFIKELAKKAIDGLVSTGNDRILKAADRISTISKSQFKDSLMKKKIDGISEQSVYDKLFSEKNKNTEVDDSPEEVLQENIDFDAEESNDIQQVENSSIEEVELKVDSAPVFESVEKTDEDQNDDTTSSAVKKGGRPKGSTNKKKKKKK